MIDRLQSGRSGHAYGAFLGTLALLAVGLWSPSAQWGTLERLRDSARSQELNQAERERGAAGYYEGLISVSATSGTRDELALRLLGKPANWLRFQDADATDLLPSDLLQFQLIPNVDREIQGKQFSTNSHGLRDRPYTLETPPNTFRIALLGSSMDMGWGVATEETYENLFEDWLNAHARLRGVDRRFEVLNFAVAAYGPLQRLETFRRKAREFRPDLVIYSATLLDPRLLEINLCMLLQHRVDLPENYEFLKETFHTAGIRSSDLALNPKTGDLASKERIKANLKPLSSALVEKILQTLKQECASLNAQLWGLLIPRVGKSDAPEERKPMVLQTRQTFDRQAIPMLDLTATFDGLDPAELEIAAYDDHPNTEGHHKLFRSLARSLVDNPPLYRLLFQIDPPPSTRRDQDSSSTSER